MKSPSVLVEQRRHSLWPGVLTALALTALICVGTIPSGPVRVVEGRVIGFEVGGVRGNQRVMTVRTAERDVAVYSPVVLGCEIGDRARLRRIPHLWGVSYQTGYLGLTCVRPPVRTHSVRTRSSAEQASDSARHR